ncbi:hypothetical protein BHE74_00022566 [Ensete ventricosum]|nr:hypothetical protein BHE74_00022566 [Ensete ventricosum]
MAFLHDPTGDQSRTHGLPNPRSCSRVKPNVPTDPPQVSQSNLDDPTQAGRIVTYRRKILISLGVLGGGYFVYKLYESHRRRLSDLERQLDGSRQRISDTTTLPYAMHYLRSRISKDLDLSHLTEKLMQGKGHSSSLAVKEKFELWERLKILSILLALCLGFCSHLSSNML